MTRFWSALANGTDRHRTNPHQVSDTDVLQFTHHLSFRFAEEFLMSLDVTRSKQLRTLALDRTLSQFIISTWYYHIYIYVLVVSYNDNVHMLVSFSMLYIQIHGHSDCTKIVRGQPWMKLPRSQIVTHQYSVIRQNQVKGFREAVAWRQRRRREPAGKIRGSIRGKRKWYQCFAMKHV